MTKKTIEKLSEHYFLNIKLGLYYLNLSSQASNFGMANFAKYIKELSDDKLTIHKDLIGTYFNDTESQIQGKLTILENKSFNSAQDIINELYIQEKNVRTIVNDIASTCIDEKDFESFEFIQWFVKDGLKDFTEVVSIKDLFNTSKDLLLIDTNIKSLFEK